MKFLVLRLLSPAIQRRRKEIVGDGDSAQWQRLLLRNGRDLEPRIRWALRPWLAAHPELRALYDGKELLSGFYRIRSFAQAARARGARRGRRAGGGRREG